MQSDRNSCNQAAKQIIRLPAHPLEDLYMHFKLRPHTCNQVTRAAREDLLARISFTREALQQCAREARVLEDNSRVLLEYSKATRVIL